MTREKSDNRNYYTVNYSGLVVNKNGLDNRIREKKVGFWIAAVSGFLLLSFFIAPLTVENGKIPKLSGRANSLDYMTVNDSFSWGNKQTSDFNEIGHNQAEYGYFAWSELNFYAAAIYAFGDLNCHQKHERSWEINGNQMPVCTRDVGIFFGAFILGLAWMRLGHNRWTIKDTFLSIFPDRKLNPIYEINRRGTAFYGLGLLCVLPIVLDGGLQAVTDYESNTIKRLFTGSLFGIGFMWFFCSSLCAKPSHFQDESQVLLPANARFVQPDKFHQETNDE